ncbi:MAG: hypothetical protein PHE50_04790 [Dehalococcoidales bacterium]|nr:hypothetical protein [Dehalococcoidales bacterium]
MLRIATKTKLTPEKIIEKAIDFFGLNGYKMTITSKTPSSIYFEGGGGLVEIAVTGEAGKNTVDFLSREWDFQVKEFIKLIK